MHRWTERTFGGLLVYREICQPNYLSFLSNELVYLNDVHKLYVYICRFVTVSDKCSTCQSLAVRVKPFNPVKNIELEIKYAHVITKRYDDV